MARRKSDGVAAHTNVGKAGGREDDGDMAKIVRGEKHTGDAQIEMDQTAAPATEELVKGADVVDIRHTHDVTTGRRRVVVLPADLCRRLSISEGTPLRLVEHESHFEVVPMRLVPATEGISYELDLLLAGVTPENIHGEIDLGPAVGRESW